MVRLEDWYPNLDGVESMSELSAAFVRGSILTLVLSVGSGGVTWKFLTWLGIGADTSSTVGVTIGVAAALLGIVSTFIDCGEVPEKKSWP
jgi:hypothetical protein